MFDPATAVYNSWFGLNVNVMHATQCIVNLEIS
jgi:hypothetical protein